MANSIEKDKETLAKNLAFYRKNAKYTQLEIAEQFNYSDKAVSKWERGESAPDVFILKALADFYGISLTDFFKEKPKQPRFYRNHVKHLLITFLSIGVVWLVATVLYAILMLVSIPSDFIWYTFIAAIPISCILMIIFSSLWGNKLLTLCAVSALCWSTTLLIYLPCELLTDWQNMAFLWIIPVPLQIMAVLWYFLKWNDIFRRRRIEKREKEALNNQNLQD